MFKVVPSIYEAYRIQNMQRPVIPMFSKGVSVYTNPSIDDNTIAILGGKYYEAEDINKRNYNLVGIANKMKLQSSPEVQKYIQSRERDRYEAKFIKKAGKVVVENMNIKKKNNMLGLSLKNRTEDVIQTQQELLYSELEKEQLLKERIINAPKWNIDIFESKIENTAKRLQKLEIRNEKLEKYYIDLVKQFPVADYKKGIIRFKLAYKSNLDLPIILSTHTSYDLFVRLYRLANFQRIDFYKRQNDITEQWLNDLPVGFIKHKLITKNKETIDLYIYKFQK